MFVTIQMTFVNSGAMCVRPRPPRGTGERATEAVDEGLMPGLVALAMESRSSGMSADELFRIALHEIGLQEMQPLEAARFCALSMARRILTGEISPYAGAKAIWDVALALDPRTHEFDPFIYAASEYEDRPRRGIREAFSRGPRS